MSGVQIDKATEEIDIAMQKLKAAMRNIPVMRAGFRYLHDSCARKVGILCVGLADSKALLTRD